MKRVSIVIATYNCSRFLPQTLTSILAQDYPRFEILLIDDGSTDDTPSVVAPYLGDDVRYVRLERSGGPSKPRNVGIEMARGEYVFFFDSDDVMLPGKISRSVSLLENTARVGLVFTDFMMTAEDGTTVRPSAVAAYPHFRGLPKTRVDEDMYVVSAQVAYEGLIYENYIGTSGVAIPTAIAREMGGFDEALPNAEDHELWFRIARRYDLGYVDRVGHQYRTRQGSILTQPAERQAPNRITVLRRQLQYGLSKAAARHARRIIAANYAEMGYQQHRVGQVHRARRHYMQGLGEAVTWPLLKGFLSTLVDPRLLRRSPSGVLR